MGSRSTQAPLTYWNTGTVEMQLPGVTAADFPVGLQSTSPNNGTGPL